MLHFQLVMHFLYKGGCQQLSVGQTDVLELMAAANFFQLDRLLRFCEARCAKLVDLDNIVSMYIHAKVRLRVKNQVHTRLHTMLSLPKKLPFLTASHKER